MKSRGSRLLVFFNRQHHLMQGQAPMLWRQIQQLMRKILSLEQIVKSEKQNFTSNQRKSSLTQNQEEKISDLEVLHKEEILELISHIEFLKKE